MFKTKSLSIVESKSWVNPVIMYGVQNVVLKGVTGDMYGSWTENVVLWQKILFVWDI